MSVRISIGQESIDLLHGGWQPRQVETDATKPSLSVCLGGRPSPVGFHVSCEKCINGIPDPVGIAGMGHGRTGWRNERPMPLPGGSLFNPTSEHISLLLSQLLVRVEWRHSQVGIVRRDPRPGVAIIESVAAKGQFDAVLLVQSQVGLAMVRIRTMALEAVVGKDGAYVTIELGCLLTLAGGGKRTANGQNAKPPPDSRTDEIPHDFSQQNSESSGARWG